MSSIVLPITQAPVAATKKAAPPTMITPPEFHYGVGNDDVAFADLAEIPEMELVMAQQRAQQRAEVPAKRRTTITDVAFNAVVGTGTALTSVGKSSVSAVQIVGQTGVNAVQSAGKTSVSAVQSAVAGTGAVALNVGLNVPLNMVGKTAKMLGSVVPMPRLSSATDLGHAPLNESNGDGEDKEEPTKCNDSSETSADAIGEPIQGSKCNDTSQQSDDSFVDGETQGSGETFKPPRREVMTFKEGTATQVEHSDDQTETWTPDAKLTELLGYNTYEDQTIELNSSSQEDTKAKARKSGSSKNRRRDGRGSKTDLKKEDGTEHKEKMSSSRSSSTPRKSKLSRTLSKTSETGTRSKRDSGRIKRKTQSPRRSTDDKKTLQRTAEEALKELPKEEQGTEGMPAQRKSDTYLGGMPNSHGDSDEDVPMTSPPMRASSDTSLRSSRHKKDSTRKSRNRNKSSAAASSRSTSPKPSMMSSTTREGFLTRAKSCRGMTIEQRRTQNLRQSCLIGSSTASAVRQLGSDSPLESGNSSNNHRLQRADSFRMQSLKENSQGNNRQPLVRSRSTCSARPSSKFGRSAKKNLEDNDGLESAESWHGDQPPPSITAQPSADSTAPVELKDMAESIVVMMDMMQGMQAEIVALRQEVKELKAERDLASSNSNHDCVCKAEKYSSGLAEIRPGSGHGLPSLYYASSNKDESESEEEEDDDINSVN